TTNSFLFRHSSSHFATLVLHLPANSRIPQLSPLMASFIEVRPDSHFPIQNIPYGVFKHKPSGLPRPAVAIGDYVLDLSEIALAGLFDGPVLSSSDCFLQPNLNKFLSLGRPAWKEARATLQKLLSCMDLPCAWFSNPENSIDSLFNEVEMLLPVAIGDYSDFFSSMHHAKNCGTMFRGPQNAINLNWFHLPIAYHGRASSIVISGTDIIRPRGQGPPSGSSTPYFGPSQKLDFELEMAAIVGPGNELGKPIDVNEAADHIFGLVLMNDWSARDIQAWEYIPLGPFLGKSFSTTISPWIVTLDALSPFTCDAPKQDPPPLPYLAEKISQNYDISLEVQIKPAGLQESSVVTRTNFNHLYWTVTQQLAHHTVNGCNLRPGDLLGTGTISGPEPESYGCLLELTWNGQNPLSLNGATRKFLEDGDEVTISGFCKGDGYNVGFGTCTGKILPSSKP
ncbi:FAH, partial [Linum perenne]